MKCQDSGGPRAMVDLAVIMRFTHGVVGTGVPSTQRELSSVEVTEMPEFTACQACVPKGGLP